MKEMLLPGTTKAAAADEAGENGHTTWNSHQEGVK